MPKVDSHAHGHPSWADLATTDQDAAKIFYGELFGWTYEDNAMAGTDEVYSMAQLNGDYAGAIFTQSPQQTAAGIPSMWTTYLSVDDADAAFAKVAAALLKVDAVRLYHDQALFKEAGGGHTPWHQDQYCRPLDTEHTLTIWIPLVGVSRDMGSLQFVPKSHKEGHLGDFPISDESERYFQNLLRERELDILENPELDVLMLVMLEMEYDNANFKLSWSEMSTLFPPIMISTSPINSFV